MKKKLYNSFLTIKERGLLVFLVAFLYSIKLFFSKVIKKKYIKKKIFNSLMYLDVNDPGISKTLILFGKRELEHKYIMNKVIKKNMNILDIGANIGYYALIELDIIRDSGYLIACEPSPSNFKLLNKNILLNKHKNYETHNIAISNSNSTKEFHLSKSSNLNTFHKTDDLGLQLSGKKIQVETSTIFQLVKNKKIDLIRMDVEGHEVAILETLLDYINHTSFKPMVLFEPHISRYNKSNNIIKPLSDLFKHGYKVEYIGSSWENGSILIENKGYNFLHSLNTDGVERRIYANITKEDLISFITKEGGVRTVLLKAN